MLIEFFILSVNTVVGNYGNDLVKITRFLTQVM
jgi:hypothetical protein